MCNVVIARYPHTQQFSSNTLISYIFSNTLIAHTQYFSHFSLFYILVTTFPILLIPFQTTLAIGARCHDLNLILKNKKFKKILINLN